MHIHSLTDTKFCPSVLITRPRILKFVALFSNLPFLPFFNLPFLPFFSPHKQSDILPRCQKNQHPFRTYHQTFYKKSHTYCAAESKTKWHWEVPGFSVGQGSNSSLKCLSCFPSRYFPIMFFKDPSVRRCILTLAKVCLNLKLKLQSLP
jgi:hypothetical protein